MTAQSNFYCTSRNISNFRYLYFVFLSYVHFNFIFTYDIILPQIGDIKCWTALFLAARYDRVAMANRLIEAGADIFVKDLCEATPMHWASSYGHTDIMNMLLAVSKGREKKV